MTANGSTRPVHGQRWGRVFTAWRSLRRGAPQQAMRWLYDRGDQRLEPSQVDVLDHTFEHGPVAMGDLARALGIDASTATRVADRLVRRGLLARRSDPSDGRMVRVALTESGRATCERYRSERARFLDLIFADFSADELDAGAAFIEKLVESTSRALTVSTRTTNERGTHAAESAATDARPAGRA